MYKKKIGYMFEKSPIVDAFKFTPQSLNDMTAQLFIKLNSFFA
jgi:hypothetical protein